MVNHFRLELPIKFSSGFIFIYHVGWVVGGMVVTTMTYNHVWNHFRVDLTLWRVENTLKIWLAIPAWNVRPFKAGIVNQIINWVYLYLSCWMGSWWYGSNHNDILSCLDNFRADLTFSREENTLKIWLTIPALNGRPFQAGIADQDHVIILVETGDFDYDSYSGSRICTRTTFIYWISPDCCKGEINWSYR